MKSDWARLPNHLFDSVIERILADSDYLRFSVVCMSWQYVAKDNFSKRFTPPLLLIPTAEEGVWNFYNVQYGEVLNLQLRLPNRRFCGSSKGWLIFLEDDMSITLLNPFTKIEGREEQENSMVRLPPLHFLYGLERYKDYGVHKAMMSSDPISNANDCIIVVIYEDLCSMAFIRLGKDPKWTRIGKRQTGMEEVIFVENKFYAIDVHSCLINFDPSPYKFSKLGGYMRQVEVSAKYLVSVSDKELLLVHRYHYEVTEDFSVFEWDFDLRRWIEKKTLNSIALFIGDNSSVYVLASPNSKCIKPNFIYFNFCNRRLGEIQMAKYGHDYGAYDYEKRCILKQPPYNEFAKKLMDIAKKPAIWVDVPAKSCANLAEKNYL